MSVNRISWTQIFPSPENIPDPETKTWAKKLHDFLMDKIRELSGQSVIINEDLANYVKRDGSSTYTATGAGFKDEDNMASDSAVATPSQQSVKAYADTKEPLLTKGAIGATLPISITADRQVIGGTATIAIADAKADATTKGAATFVANDFTDSSGLIGIDYTNGQASSGTTKGFLTSTDWTTFNNKEGALTKGNLTATAPINLSATERQVIGGAVVISATTATTAASGVVSELATTAETTTGTDTSRVVTPDGLAGSVFGRKTVVLKVISDTTALTTGDGKMYFTIPVDLNGMHLVDADACVYTGSTSGQPTIQLARGRASGSPVTWSYTDILTTRITIDATNPVTEWSSYTAAAPAEIIEANSDVINNGTDQTDRIRVDVDTAGTGTAGLELHLVFEKV